MFKRNAIKDERITNAQNRIYRELYTVIMIICGISLLVKSMFAAGEGQSLVTELVILIVGGVYYLIRSANMGIYSEEMELKSRNSKWNTEKKYTMFTTLSVVGVGIVLGVVFGLNSAMNYADSTGQAVKYFILVFLTTVIMYTPVMFIVMYVPHAVAKKRSERVNERMLGADDER